MERNEAIRSAYRLTGGNNFYDGIEEHFKYRPAVMKAYPCGHYPVFEGYDHMQYQIRDPKGFAGMLTHIAERDCMPELPFIRK